MEGVRGPYDNNFSETFSNAFVRREFVMMDKTGASREIKSFKFIKLATTGEKKFSKLITPAKTGALVQINL